MAQVLSGWTPGQEGCGPHGLGHLHPLGTPKSHGARKVGCQRRC